MTIKTKIHGKMYDLTNFIHPGGKVPMYLINNKDGTCLFESYHPVSNRKMLNKILAKYEIVDDNSINEQQIYDFTNFSKDPFVMEVRETVYNYFKDISIKNNCSLIEATKMTHYRIYEILILFCGFIFSLILFINNTLIGLFLMPIFLWYFTINTYHDMSHFAFSKNKLIENILLPLHFVIYPTFSWQEDHVYTHHTYPNVINIDSDLERYVGFYKPIQKNHYLLDNPISNFIEQIIFSDKKIDKYRFLDYFNYIYLLQTFLYIIVKILFLKLLFFDTLINYGILNAILYTIIPLAFYVISFLICTQINHIHTTNFVNNKNFYKHQIITAHNVSSQSFLIRLYSGGLNLQIEHHLFPSVNSCHLPALSKIIKPLCLKHNIKYNESSSLYQAIKDTLKTTKKLTFKTISNFDFKII